MYQVGQKVELNEKASLLTKVSGDMISDVTNRACDVFAEVFNVPTDVVMESAGVQKVSRDDDEYILSDANGNMTPDCKVVPRSSFSLAVAYMGLAEDMKRSFSIQFKEVMPELNGYMWKIDFEATELEIIELPNTTKSSFEEDVLGGLAAVFGGNGDRFKRSGGIG